MPPKRKRNVATTADAETTARSSRTSSRSMTAARLQAETLASENATTVDEPRLKKAKRSSARSNSLKKTKGKSKSPAITTDAPTVTVSNDHDNVPEANTSKTPAVHEPYSPASAAALFSSYSELNSKTIGPEGFERLCTEATIPLEGSLPLLLSWQLNAKDLAKITEQEWQAGTTELQISHLQVLCLALHDLEDLLILGKPPITPPAAIPSGKPGKKKSNGTVPLADPYNRARYYRYTANIKESYTEFYTYCFSLAKPESSRNVDMETAVAFWSVVLVPKYTMIQDVIEFINERGTYKSVNKDLWNMMLEFSHSVSPDFKDYDADGAWPTLLDDFVVWKTNKVEKNIAGPSSEDK